MINFVKGSSVFVLFFISVIALSAQNIKNGERDHFVNNKCKVLDESDNYVQLAYKQFSFCIPVELIEQNVKCRDSFCREFENDKMILRLDTDPNAGIPVLERTYTNYHEEFILVDNKKVWHWSYLEQDAKYKYTAGAHFRSGKHDYYDLAVIIIYKDSNDKEIENKIFNSVRFNLD